MLPDLTKKSVNIESVANRALKDEKVFTELLEGILSKNDTLRFNSFKILLHISEEHPDRLYLKWDFFVNLLDSDNTYHKYIAIYIIANLTRADTNNKFEKIFNKYYNILDGEGTITSAHLAANSGKIAKAKPKLQSKITNRLLNIDKTHRGKQKEIIKGYAIEAFNEYFKEVKNKKKIIEFVKKQLKSKSPRTRKEAEKFLNKWDKRPRNY